MVNGTVKVQKSIYNITENLAKAGEDYSEYTSVQGYTINDTNTASFLAVRKNDSEMAALAYITNLNSIPKVNPGRRLWHANDCAFYKGNYFIAMGSNNDNDLITDIKCFDKSLERIATYSYVPMSGETQLNYISCIAYLTGDYFVVGAGLIYSICRINETAKTFNAVSQFNIVGDKIKPYLTRGSNYQRVGQGIWCIGNMFYKLFSYYIKSNSKKIIKHNDLAVFQMPGVAPYISGEASLVRYYSCDRPTKDSFELESLASPDNGTTFYIAANVKEANATKQKDSIYSATLSNS